jgi:hypothetical protein
MKMTPSRHQGRRIINQSIDLIDSCKEKEDR